MSTVEDTVTEERREQERARKAQRERERRAERKAARDEARSNRLPDVEPWATVLEVAVHLGVSEATVWRAIRQSVNPLPSHKIGHNRRLRLSEVDAWVLGGGELHTD